MALHTIVEHDTTHIKPYIDNVKQALSDEVEVRAELGAHNLLKLDIEEIKSLNTDGTWSGNAYTLKGVTFTVNSDYTISTSGTASENTTFYLYRYSTWTKLPLRFLSGCPSGGGMDKYILRLVRGGAFSKNDTGEGVLLDQNDVASPVDVTMVVVSGNNVSGLTFKPMIRLATDASTTYQPYSKTNVELTQGLSEVQDLVLDQGGITTKSYAPVIAVNDALPVNAVDVSAKIEPIQAGSGTPSPSNVRAISGRSEVTVTRAGKNLVEGKLANLNIGSDGTLTSTTEFNVFFAKVKQGNIYSITTQDSSTTTRVYAFYESKPTTTSVSYNGSRTVVSGVNSFTAPIDGYVAFRAVAAFTAPQLELGSTATAYEAPNVNDYTIQLGDTYYGGTLDVTTGVLTVDRGYAEFDGSVDEQWDITTLNNKTRFNCSRAFSNCNENTITHISNELQLAPDNNATHCYNSDGYFAVYYTNNNGTLYLSGSLANDVSALRTWLANEPLQVCYTLKESITVQLTPQEIQMLQGNNTIFTDSGDTSIQYYANGVKNLETVVAEMQTEADGAVNNQFQNGAVNLLENKASSVAHSSVTAIVNNDKTITINGAPSSNFVLQLGTIILDSTKKYKLSGCPKNQPTNTQLRFTDNGGNNYFDYGDGVEFTGASSGTVYLICYSATGNTFKNAVFKPMITLADVPNSDYAHYVPYAKSNKELTDEQVTYVSGVPSLAYTPDNIDFTGTTQITIPEDGLYHLAVQNNIANSGSALVIRLGTDTTKSEVAVHRTVGNPYEKAQAILPLKKGTVVTFTCNNAELPCQVQHYKFIY